MDTIPSLPTYKAKGGSNWFPFPSLRIPPSHSVKPPWNKETESLTRLTGQSSLLHSYILNLRISDVSGLTFAGQCKVAWDVPLAQAAKLQRVNSGAHRQTICLPMKETRVRSLIQEDPMYYTETQPGSHSYWAHELQPLKPGCPRVWCSSREAAHHKWREAPACRN